MAGSASLCVFTPTYNRSHTLPRLYESLLRQTSDDFEWVVVDDGSTDNTEELIAQYIDEKKINITYIRTQNGGKQRAHNVGVEKCTAPLFLCVDSDDFLVPVAVEHLLSAWKLQENGEGISGILFLKGFTSNKPLGPEFPDGLKRTTLRNLYSKYHFRGDTGLMYRTDVLKKYPFWVAPGEKFIGENYVYDQIDQKYELLLLNEILYIAEYLADGYTKNVRKVTKENPVSYLTLKRQSITFDSTLHEKYRDTILYLVGCMLANKEGGVREAPSRMLAIMAYLPALIAKTLFFS